ncbi:MAG: radical SAM protein [Prevotella sp.]|nr:radical SAM protein [Prevotella sp.]
MTILYDSPIFGPVHSRRLGLSLGINLMPADGKVCTFDCIYCECGLNAQRRPTLPRPTRREVAEALETKLKQMVADGQRPDVLTFAGNGEPTAHPDFANIIDDTIRLRNLYCPEAKVSVLSNATQLHRKDVFEALLRVDNNIQKLDTVDPDFIRAVDRPTSPNYDVRNVISQLKAFNGHVIIQTIFLNFEERGTRSEERGARNEKRETRSEEREMSPDSCFLTPPPKGGGWEGALSPWLAALKEIAPQSVMIYTIDRETPVGGLQKATPDELNRIRDLVIAEGIPCTASY